MSIQKIILAISCIVLFSIALFGQDEMSEPAVFVEGIISTDSVEYYPAFMPDGKTVYFGRTAGFTTGARRSIFVSHRKNGEWGIPVVAPFSGKYSDNSPFITGDGKQLFFTSKRPVDGKPKEDSDIWMMEKNGDAWGPPVHLGSLVNSDESEYAPSVTLDGTLYFGSTREGGIGWGDVYRSRKVNGVYQAPENLGTAINTSDGEWGSIIAPDESFLIFEASGRRENLSESGDLYISFNKKGQWSPAKHLGEMMNSSGSDLAPRLSQDGKTLFYSRSDVYYKDVDILYIDLETVLKIGRASNP